MGLINGIKLNQLESAIAKEHVILRVAEEMDGNTTSAWKVSYNINKNYRKQNIKQNKPKRKAKQNKTQSKAKQNINQSKTKNKQKQKLDFCNYYSFHERSK